MGVSNHLPCNIEDVVDLLSIPVVRSSGTQLHCRCPFCDDRKAHLNINLSKNVFRCNRCGTGGGVLHLYAEVNNISINTAYEELCRIFQSGEKAPEHPVRKAQTKVKQSKPALELASVEARDNTYSIGVALSGGTIPGEAARVSRKDMNLLFLAFVPTSCPSMEFSGSSASMQSDRDEVFSTKRASDGTAARSPYSLLSYIEGEFSFWSE